MTTYIDPVGRKSVIKKGKRFAVFALWPQPWGKYSVWLVQETVDTKEAGKAVVVEVMSWKEDRRPDDTRIVEREDE
jgi:hypothetical protein